MVSIAEPGDRLITTREAVYLLGGKKMELRRAVAAGKLEPVVRKDGLAGGGSNIYSYLDVQGYIQHVKTAKQRATPLPSELRSRAAYRARKVAKVGGAR